MDRLLTSQEAAKFLGVKVEVFEDMVQKYRIPYYKIAGKFIRFSQQELKRYKKELTKFTSTKNIEGDKDKKREKEVKIVSSRKIDNISWNFTLGEKMLEFLKFNDFYIISFIVILLLLYYIFKF